MTDYTRIDLVLNTVIKKRKKNYKTDEEMMDELLSILKGYSDNERLGVPNTLQMSRLRFEEIITDIIGYRTHPESIRRRLLDRLYRDGYVEKYPHKITESGAKFILDIGYVRQKREKEIDLRLKEMSIEKLHYDKWAFWLSIVSLIIASCALVTQILKD